jgi:hypothetical protein
MPATNATVHPPQVGGGRISPTKTPGMTEMAQRLGRQTPGAGHYLGNGATRLPSARAPAYRIQQGSPYNLYAVVGRGHVSLLAD